MRATVVAAVLIAASAASPARGQTEPEWAGIAASRRPDGAVLVWNDREAWLSADGVRPFRRVADGGRPILDGAVGDDGSWSLVRDEDGENNTVEVHTASGGVRRHSLPYVGRVVMGGSTIAAANGAELHVSTNRGRRFVVREVPGPWGGGSVLSSWASDFDVMTSGVLVATDTEINTCGSSDRLEWMRRLRVRTDGVVEQIHIALSPTDYAAEFRVGAHGWLYGVSYANRLLAHGPRDAKPVRGIGRVSPDARIAHNGRITLALDDGALLRLSGARARRLGDGLDGALDLAVDGRGRALALTADGIYRWSRRDGWRPLPVR